MSQFSLQPSLRAESGFSRGLRIGEPKTQRMARSPAGALLRAMRYIWQSGGGPVNGDVLRTQFGLRLSDAELVTCMELLAELELVYHVGDAGDEVIYELTPEGVRRAGQLESALSQQMAEPC